MIRKKDVHSEKNTKDAQITKNSFTQAVKKAGKGGGSAGIIKDKKDHPDTDLKGLKARDELMRAKEARNETTGESERFRRDEN